MQKVIVSECKEYDAEIIQKLIKKSFIQLGFKIKKESKVLIKPNVLIGVKPSKSVTTHPEFLRGLIRLLHENRCEVVIGESSSDTGDHATLRALKITGIAGMAQEEGVKLIPFETTKLVTKKTDGVVLKEITKPLILDEVDCIINAPKMKTHSLMDITGAVKNMFGSIAGGQKQSFHVEVQDKFADLIIDVHEANKPAVSVMDAIVGLEGPGPGSGGSPKPTGYILASQNSYALDYLQERIMGFDSHTAVLDKAIKRGLLVPDQVKIIGEYQNKNYKKAKNFSNLQNYIPKKMVGFAFGQIQKKPHFDEKLCIKCKDCFKICPVKAIEMPDYPVLVENKCISCYCCHEVCKYKAIELKAKPLGNAILGLAKALKLG